VEWQGTKFMGELVKRRKSCIIFSEKGAGKSSAAALIDGDHDDMMTIIEQDLPEIYHDFFLELGSPWDNLKYTFPRHQRNPWPVAECRSCQEACQVSRSHEYNGGFIFKEPKYDDIVNVLNEHAGEKLCPFIMKVVHHKLNDLPHLIVIRLPYPEAKQVQHFMQLLCRLLRANRQLIILADTEQLPWLETEELARLRRYPFSHPDTDLLEAILVKRMLHAGVSSIPISGAGLHLLASLDSNPGRFLS